MDSEEEQFFEYESDSESDSFHDTVDVPKAPSFETLTADQIVDLMEQNMDHVGSVVEVSSF